MMIKMGRQQQAEARRQLLGDAVWVVCNDTLRELQRDGVTMLSPVEVFMSAREFCDVVLLLQDVEEGLPYEMDDLVDEAGEDDALLVMTVATLMMQARSKRCVGNDISKVILLIFERLNDHNRFMPLLERFAHKEEQRWIEGKRADLLNYELKEVELNGGGSEEVRNLFEQMVTYSDKMDNETIKGNLLFLNRYNIDHNHAYDEEVIALFEKFGFKSTTTQNIKEYVGVKHVETEIDNIEPGGTGVFKEIHKD